MLPFEGFFTDLMLLKMVELTQAYGPLIRRL